MPYARDWEHYAKEVARQLKIAAEEIESSLRILRADPEPDEYALRRLRNSLDALQKLRSLRPPE